VGYVQLASVPAVDSRAALLRLAVLVTVAVLLVDVASKNWALAVVGSGYVDLGLVALTVVENEALAFSIGTGVLGPTTVVALRLGALAALLILAWRFGPASLRFALGFALVIGGGLGNASDVVLRNGAVVDFISTAPLTRGLLSGTSVEGVVLNLADVWVLAGLFLLYPLFRALGVAVQRRLVRLEERILGSGGPAGIPVEVTHLPAPRSTRS
jgi:lipoprotein signal peptidase